jgi:hypothetical protein
LAFDKPIPSAFLIAAAIRPIPAFDIKFVPDPAELEYKLSSFCLLREVTDEREMLNILLPPPPNRFSAENALLIVPTLLSE